MSSEIKPKSLKKATKHWNLIQQIHFISVKITNQLLDTEIKPKALNKTNSSTELWSKLENNKFNTGILKSNENQANLTPEPKPKSKCFGKKILNKEKKINSIPGFSTNSFLKVYNAQINQISILPFQILVS